MLGRIAKNTSEDLYCNECTNVVRTDLVKEISARWPAGYEASTVVVSRLTRYLAENRKRI